MSKKSLQEKTKESLIILQKSKKIIYDIIKKNRDKQNLEHIITKITAVEELIKDSYKTTINNNNISNSDAKQNFIILFEMADNIAIAVEELRKQI